MFLLMPGRGNINIRIRHQLNADLIQRKYTKSLKILKYRMIFTSKKVIIRRLQAGRAER